MGGSLVTTVQRTVPDFKFNTHRLSREGLRLVASLKVCPRTAGRDHCPVLCGGQRWVPTFRGIITKSKLIHMRATRTEKEFQGG